MTLEVELDQVQAAKDLLANMDADGLLADRVSVLDLLDEMAVLGLSFVHSPASSEAYFEELTST